MKQAGLRAAEAQLLSQRAAERSEAVSAAAGERPAMPLEAADGAAAAEALLAAEAMLAANPALEAAKCARLEVHALVVQCAQDGLQGCLLKQKTGRPGLVLRCWPKHAAGGHCRQRENPSLDSPVYILQCRIQRHV